MNATAVNGLHRMHRSRGFSMVEALVALVVLSVGMLGIASLYVTTLRSSGSAISRMQAVNLASDLGDRIRANRDAGNAYASDGDEAASAVQCIGPGANCSRQEMAAYDLSIWQQQINVALPGNPSGTVDVDDSTEPTTYEIEVSWSEPGEAEPLSYTMRMQI